MRIIESFHLLLWIIHKKIQKVKIEDNNKLYFIKSPITFENETKGWVVIAQEEGALKEVNQDHGWLAVMMGACSCSRVRCHLCSFTKSITSHPKRC